MERQSHENMSSEERIIRIDETVFYIKEQLAAGAIVMDNHEKRICNIEKQRMWLIGVAAGISFFFYVIKDIFKFIINK
jgi:ligand-binding sensor domain-containing protein